MKTTGILGGTFDPVHRGHLNVAQQVQQRLFLDHIEFMPCNVPVHRDQPRAGSQDRLNMLELAVSGNPGWRVNSIELDRAGSSYTVDSLRQLRRLQPRTSLLLILGDDAFNGFNRWKSPDEILDLANLVVCQRPGSGVDRDIFSDRQTDDPQSLKSIFSGRILILDIELNHCSSTDVRRSLSTSKPLLNCLTPAVYQYIRQHQLYGARRG